MAKLLSFLVESFTKFLNLPLLLWGLVKIFFVSLFTIVIPSLIYKFILKLINDAVMIYSDTLANNPIDLDLTIQLTGFGGYLANEVGLPLIVSMFFAAISLRFLLNLIPFIKV